MANGIESDTRNIAVGDFLAAINADVMSGETTPVVPKIVVFDLDACLWYPEMDMLSGAPFREHTTPHTLKDRRGTKLGLYAGVAEILRELHTHPKWKDSEVGYASRTDCVDEAKMCLRLMKVCHERGITMHDVATHIQIFPGRKLTHFQRIHKASGVPYEDMIFFDNEYRNIADVSTLGVCCVYVPDGMSAAGWETGLKAFVEGKTSGTGHKDFSKSRPPRGWY